MRRRENSGGGRKRQQARYAETLGLILIALIIFAITWARFARHLSWSWR